MAHPDSTPRDKPRWFSIKEAAEYLDIGEPTLYRWMRDGKITFRKVGDSTRFLQEDLDGVIEVHPSSKDVGRVTAQCPVCNGTDLVEGYIQSTGLAYFRLKRSKFWVFSEGNVPTTARMCSRCGAVVWFGDLQKLNELRSEPPAPKPDLERPSDDAR